MPPPNRVTLPIKDTASARPQNKKVLVLDMDETLVHTIDHKPSFGFDYIELSVDGQTGYALKRPHVDDFLARVVREFDVYIFTAGSKDYAQQILDKLCPFIPESHRFYRDSCAVVSGRCYKDLRLVHNNFAEIILVDDSPDASSFYPRNTISIAPWTGNRSDNQLTNIYPLLRNCNSAKDVRVPLRVVSNVMLAATAPKNRKIRACQRRPNRRL